MSHDVLGRARQELQAARLLAEAGFAPQAMSRAYYAAFYAAEAALMEIGETRPKHSGVVAAFAQRIVRDQDLDPGVGRLLRSLFDRRGQADYGVAPVPVDEARRAIHDAEIVVNAIRIWLAERPQHESGQ